jgi:DUF3096 family protein
MQPSARRLAFIWRVQPMTFTVSAGPLVALIAGILILIIPRLLNYIIALYLIIIGILGLSGHARAETVQPTAARYVITQGALPAAGRNAAAHGTDTPSCIGCPPRVA